MKQGVERKMGCNNKNKIFQVLCDYLLSIK